MKAVTCILPLLLIALPAAADTLRVAVASNFNAAAQAITSAFETATGHEVILAFGSTGKHYAQIRHGAPFDVFLAADRERPARLEAEGLAIAGSRFTYAVGQLALWSPQPGLLDENGQILSTGHFRHLAIANPRLAPYGHAARQVLEKQGLWASLQDRLVQGENIGQTFRFVHSGGAGLGFVALSQVRQPEQPLAGSLWLPPAELYDPIEQQAVLLRDRPAGRTFVAYLQGDTARAIMRDHGYQTP